VAEEVGRLHNEYGIRFFFGTDDNFFNDAERALDIAEKLYAAPGSPQPLHRRIRWGTEATVHDTLRMRDHLDLFHRAGVRGLWLGVEDMSGALVRKGQGYDRTAEAFRLLRDHGISPMPMMMHHDSQPLVTRGSSRGLLNQVSLLRHAGAVGLQVLMLTPSAGSRSYERTFATGQVIQSAGGRAVGPHMFDGNYVIASARRRPWPLQLNMLAAYLFFYNPLRLMWSLARRGRLGYKPALVQVLGIWGLLHTIRRTAGWTVRLLLGRIRRFTRTPRGPFPIRSPVGGHASHDPDETP
jgi:hypothetical protein